MSKKNFLTESELDAFFAAAKRTRNGVRDYCMSLMAFRHGLRVSELIDIRLSEVDFDTARVYVRRIKNGTSTHQPIEGDELRALRAWLRDRAVMPGAHSDYLFLSERGAFTRQAFNYLCRVIGEKADMQIAVTPHMFRHSCGYALANKGIDTRLIQDFLGHRNIQHTVGYTKTNARRFEGLWRK